MLLKKAKKPIIHCLKKGSRPCSIQKQTLMNGELWVSNYLERSSTEQQLLAFRKVLTKTLKFDAMLICTQIRQLALFLKLRHWSIPLSITELLRSTKSQRIRPMQKSWKERHLKNLSRQDSTLRKSTPLNKQPNATSPQRNTVWLQTCSSKASSSSKQPNATWKCRNTTLPPECLKKASSTSKP